MKNKQYDYQIGDEYNTPLWFDKICWVAGILFTTFIMYRCWFMYRIDLIDDWQFYLSFLFCAMWGLFLIVSFYFIHKGSK